MTTPITILNEDDLNSLCKQFELADIQEALAKSYNIEDKINLIFTEKTDANKMLWQHYFKYKQSLKDIDNPNGEDDRLVDPHKVSACVCLAVLSTRAFALANDSSLKLTADINTITAPYEKVCGTAILLNEIFAFRCGFEFLRYAMMFSHSDKNKIEEISKFDLADIPVNRYNKNSKVKYAGYISYNLRHMWETRGSATKLIRQDALTMSMIYHNIENYYYSKL